MNAILICLLTQKKLQFFITISIDPVECGGINDALMNLVGKKLANFCVFVTAKCESNKNNLANL